MRVERRERIIRACSAVNRACAGGAGERVEAEGEAVCDFRAAGLEAWLRVRANAGAAGVDEESIQAFEANLAGNLYKLWNRLSSGSYLPPPVKAVEIPKKG